MHCCHITPSPVRIRNTTFLSTNPTFIADFDPNYGSNQVFVGGTVPVSDADPLVVPARGYLLLENYYDPATYPNGTTVTAGGVPTPATPLTIAIAMFAQHRPLVTGLPQNGEIITNNGNDRSTPDSTHLFFRHRR